MGNTRSELYEQVSVDPWWSNSQISQSKSKSDLDISLLRQRRIKIIAEKKMEIDNLRQELLNQKKENENLKKILTQRTMEDASQQTDSFEIPGQSNIHDIKVTIEELQNELKTVESEKGKNLELQTNIAELHKELQRLSSELSSFDNERKEYKTHVLALKDIIAVSKHLLLMREDQIKELKQKMTDIQASLAEKETKTLSTDLKAEYERQIKNMKHLRALYEERQQADRTTINKLKTQLEDANSAIKTFEERNGELQIRIDELEKDNDKKTDLTFNLQSQLGLAKADCGELRAEMNVINQLFSQILLGINNSQDVNLDNLIKILEENHDLLTDIFTNEGCNETSSALPKVLLNLVNQVNEKDEMVDDSSKEENAGLATITEETDSQTTQNSLNSATEIVQNLPKVWRILIELLSHQSTQTNTLNIESNDNHPCYKSIETPSGPMKVLSVSQTFIRLKDLILEKKSLEKETLRLKQLNTHLETRLQDQEKRLELVSCELSKTWHVVGKMQKQHQQLHTQEKILRYELAQKRKLLNELKEELEYCREKWLQAREKNSTTEEQWKQLRSEFAARKTVIIEDFSNSVESGYSDERESSGSDDELESAPSVSNTEIKIDDVQNPVVALDDNQGILQVIQEEIATIENASSSTSHVAFYEDPLKPELHNLESNTPENETGPEETIKTDLIQNEESLDAREVRLRRLEEEAKDLVAQTSSTSNRSIEMCMKLDTLHEQYGNEPKVVRQDIDEMYKRLEEDILQTIKKTQNVEEYPSVSRQSRTTEEILLAREERLKSLEDQSNQLISQATKTSDRSIEICSKLDNLHQQYGEGGAKRKNSKAAKEDGQCMMDTSENSALTTKEKRLQQLEEETKQLVNKANETSAKNFQICNRIDLLRSRYGESSTSDQNIDVSEEDAINPNPEEENHEKI